MHAYINTETLQYPLTENDIKVLFPNTSFSVPFSPPEGFALVFHTPHPACNDDIEYCIEGAPENTGNHWEKRWTVIPRTLEDINARRESLRQQMLQSVCQTCDSKLAVLEEGYPEREVKSWPDQVSEADAYHADPTATVTLLDNIASARGVTVQHLVTRIRTLSAAYKAAAGQIIGTRHALEDAIVAATSTAELRAIDINSGWSV